MSVKNLGKVKGEDGKSAYQIWLDLGNVGTEEDFLNSFKEENYKLKNKKISLIGDSITTFKGYIPTGYGECYPYGDIQKVEHTWWKQLIDETGMILVKNCSWGGSTVTGDSASTTNAFAGCSTARINALKDGNNIPDIIICYIGINDFGRNANFPLGNYVGRTAIPSEGTITNFTDAYGLMIKKIMSTYTSSKLYCCSLLETPSISYDSVGQHEFPTISSNVTVSEYNERIELLCKNIGAEFIDLHSCGINYWNSSKYMIDELHPNFAGATLIKNKVKSKLLNDY